MANLSNLSAMTPSLPSVSKLANASMPAMPTVGIAKRMPSFDPTQLVGEGVAASAASVFSMGEGKNEAERFQELMASHDYEKAAWFAANSPKQELRNLETIRAFQAAPPPEGAAKPPILSYFGALLARRGGLTHDEGIALARPDSPTVSKRGHCVSKLLQAADAQITKPTNKIYRKR